MDLNKIAKIEGMGKRSAEKMKKELDAHKEMTLAKFIAGYNIEGVGEKVIENIIKFYNFKTISDFFGSTSSQRFVCDGVGDVISTKLAEGLKALRFYFFRLLLIVWLFHPLLFSFDLPAVKFHHTK